MQESFSILVSHSDIWIRRTALLYQLGFKGRTDWEQLKQYMKDMLHEE